jgi:hypothetical protein
LFHNTEGRMLQQRPASFMRALQGHPFPTEHGLAAPTTVAAVEAEFEQIKAEFMAWQAGDTTAIAGGDDDGDGTASSTTKSTTSGNTGTGRVSRLNDKAAACCHVQELFFANHGEWNEEHCAHMPTICRILRGESAVAGESATTTTPTPTTPTTPTPTPTSTPTATTPKPPFLFFKMEELAVGLYPNFHINPHPNPTIAGRIDAERIAQLNAAGGWTPAPDHHGWLHADALRTLATTGAGAGGIQLEPTSFSKSKGHVPDLEVSILRLSPGAKVIPHTGSSNARLNV